MEFDQSSMIKAVTVITPTDGDAAGVSTVGAVIDVNQDERFEALTYVIQSGTITTGDFAVVLEQSPDDGAGSPTGVWTAVPSDEVIGDLPTWLVTDDDTVRRVGVIGKERHQRLTLAGANTPVGDFSAIAILGHSHVAPVTAQFITPT